MQEPQVIELTASDVHWPMDNNPPYLMIGGGRYPRRTNIDPFPCYPHDLGLVKDLVTEITELWPIPFETKFYVLHFETPDRTNGWAQMDAIEYDGKGGVKEWAASIALQGKRIPVHPAMTRYLVPHECGHLVEDAINASRGEHADNRKILQEYAALRGMECKDLAEGGTWHQHVGEIFANDFRILVAKREVEFWPHSGIPRPENLAAVIEWWEARKAELMEVQSAVAV
ncbi:MAG: hypothetical protein M1343_08340 [Chloroflexi bacterium]|nr:hypothetical protein [Chloroflexota bacterium]